MSGVVWRLSIAALVVVSAAAAAQAEDLVMPFACLASNGEVRVSPAAETTYRIYGRRNEQPFVACSAPGAACETMMVHRFAILCDGQNVAWTRVAGAARAAGISFPAGLPSGFAPVSMMSGRFVLPALIPAHQNLTSVSTQDLSPDSVAEVRDEPSRAPPGPAWVTEVRADTVPGLTGGTAVRVAGSLATVLTLLMAASLVAAGRYRNPLPQSLHLPDALSSLLRSATSRLLDVTSAVQKVFSEAGIAVLRGGHSPSDELVNALSFIEARFDEADLAISSLHPEMLLRDVLTSELQNIRKRLSDVERQMRRRAPSKSLAIVHALLRELERVSRISQVAGRGANETGSESETSSISMPQSISDAYRVLGMNADAAPAVAKKLVDALRMSWHPDHARDESDRQRREGRMKQINAAWDLIKDRRAAA